LQVPAAARRRFRRAAQVIAATAALAGAAHERPADAAPPDGETTPDAVETASASPADYDEQGARADVETVLNDRGRGYLDARARLEAHPGVAVTALRARLDHGELDPAQERRLHSVLAKLGGAELAPEHARLLRASLLAREGAEPWAELLAGSEPGRGQLTRLIGDRELAVADRAALLEVLVARSDAPEQMLVLVGKGHPALADQLWRSLVARGHQDPAAAQSLRTAIDAELVRLGAAPASADLSAAKLVGLRAELSMPADPRFADMLGSLARDEAQPFVVRFAALRGLAGLAAAPPVLEAEARAHLAARRGASPGLAQQHELLGWQALMGLGELAPARAAVIAGDFDLRRDPAPRLAAAGWRFASVDDDENWLDAVIASPWPQVSAAGLARVAAPCERARVRTLESLAGPVSKGGSEEGRVSRAAVTALGRCASGGDRTALRALRGLVDDAGVGIELRGAAARELVARDPEGSAFVAKALATADVGALAEVLANALGQADASRIGTAEVTALCGVVDRYPNAARAARAALDRVAPEQDCP